MSAESMSSNECYTNLVNQRYTIWGNAAGEPLGEIHYGCSRDGEY